MLSSFPLLLVSNFVGPLLFAGVLFRHGGQSALGNSDIHQYSPLLLQPLHPFNGAASGH